MAKSQKSASSVTPDPLNVLRLTRHVPAAQEFSVAAIHANARYQCRVEVVPGQALATNPEHVKDLADKIAGGETMYAVVLFHDRAPNSRGKLEDRYILADGFHRYVAHKKLGLKSIKAFVVEAEDADREAYIYSATANSKYAMLQPSSTDKANSFRRLLEDPEHWKLTDTALARKCNLSTGAGVRIRAAFCEERGIAIPAEGLSFRDGVPFYIKKQNSPGLPPIRMGGAKANGTHTPHCNYKGKTLYLPYSKDGIQTPKMEVARDAFVAKVDAEIAATVASRWPMSQPDFQQWLAVKGVAISTQKIARANLTILISGPDAIAILKDTTSEAVRAEAKLLDLYEMGGGTVSRRIIVGYTKGSNGQTPPIVLLLSTYGYTFMTPEELADDLLAKQADTSLAAG